MSTQKRFEIGVDYEGVSARHLQVNEEIIFSNEDANRIFMPECGSYYVDTLIIKDISTGQELVQGFDYDVFILDAKATKLSGKQVCGLIIVKNESIKGVLLDYQFVGGVHMSGYYILEQLLKMYPNGNSSVISFDEVLNKPNEFNPAYHTQHVAEFFNTKDLVVWIQRLRTAIHNRQQNTLEKMYQEAQLNFDSLYAKLNNNSQRLTAEIAEVLKSISIQADEYILTDSAVNPAIERGYGNWVLITNTILRGGPAGDFLIGSGSLIAMGSEQVIRNCYIWYNKEDSAVNEAKVIITADKETLNEGESIVFTLTTTNIPNATKLEWFLEGIDPTDVVNNVVGMGVATVSNGKATITLNVANDRKTEGNETFTLRLRDFPNVSKSFLVLDTSLDRRITKVVFLDSSNKEITSVSEDSKFKLRIASTGLIGQTIYLTWSTDAQNLSVAPPTSIVITSNSQDIALETIGNLTPNPTRIVEVTVKETNNEVVDSTTPKAMVFILDSSQALLANIVFINAADLIVTNVDEDNEFKIKIRTNGGIGQKLKLSYRSNRPLSEFSGLLNEVTIGSDNSATVVASNIANYLTATETEFLEVTATTLTGSVLATGILLLNDTTKNPNFLVSLSTVNTGVGSVSTVNEGDDVYLVFKVPGWVGATTPPSLDIILSLTGSPSLAQRVEVPPKLTGVRFDDKNSIDRVEWLNGDTLALRISAIADKAIYGNAKLNIKWKMSLASTYIDGPSLDIIDTSKPTLTASWSSSATNLNPITTVNEMQTNGGDNVCYLWLDVDGDGSTFSNLKLVLDNSTVANITDLIQTYPQSLSIVKGKNSHVIRVDILADFITEGNELLALKVTADGFSAPLVVAALTIVDNSVHIPITYTVSPSTIASSGRHSEWEDITVTINLQPLAFATTLVIEATNSDKVDGLVPGSYSIAANQSSFTLTIGAKKIRHTNGSYQVSITATRKLGTKTVSNLATQNINFINDRLPAAIKSFMILKGGSSASKLTEGESYILKVDIDRPMDNMLIVFGNTVSTTTDSGIKAGTNRHTFTQNRKVALKNATESRGTISTTVDLSLLLDRLTNPANLEMEFAVKLDWSTANSTLQVGSSYTESLVVVNSSQLYMVKALPVEDVSKTAVITGVANPTAVNEGATINFNFSITNPTVGDIYELVLDASSAIKTNRFTTHQFSSRDIAITNNTSQNLQFTAQVLENFFTDSGNTGKVNLRNKTTGEEVASLNFTINDTSKSPALTARWTDASGNTITSANEGTEFRLEVTTTNLPATFPIRLINPTGRALTEFDFNDINSNVIPVNGKAVFRFGLKENFKIDSANTFGVTAEVVGLPIAVNINVPPLTLNDTSKAPAYNINWFDLEGNNITQANEGNYVELEVVARGVPVGAALSVSLSGTGITASDLVGGALTKTTTFQALGSTGNVFASVDWNIANDVLTEGNETMVATVKINGTQVGTKNLTIVDTSLTIPVYSAYFTSDAAGNNRITQANEGDTVYAVLEAANVAADFTTSWSTYGNTGSSSGEGAWKPFENLSGNINVKNGKNVLALNIPTNYITTGNMISSIGFWIGAPINAQVMTPSLTINDVYKTPSFRGVVWSRNVEGTDPVGILNPGEEIYLVILTKNILPGQQFELSYPVMDGVKLADFDYGPHIGTLMTSITQYDEVTGDGRMAIAFKLSDNFGAVVELPPPSGPQYSAASAITGLYVGGAKTTTLQHNNVVIGKFEFEYMKPGDVLSWEIIYNTSPLSAAFSVKAAAGGVVTGTKSVRFDDYVIGGVVEFQSIMPREWYVLKLRGYGNFYLNGELVHSIRVDFPGA